MAKDFVTGIHQPRLGSVRVAVSWGIPPQSPTFVSLGWNSMLASCGPEAWDSELIGTRVLGAQIWLEHKKANAVVLWFSSLVNWEQSQAGLGQCYSAGLSPRIASDCLASEC